MDAAMAAGWIGRLDSAGEVAGTVRCMLQPPPLPGLAMLLLHENSFGRVRVRRGVEH